MFGVDLILLVTGAFRHLPTATGIGLIAAAVVASAIAIGVDAYRTRR